MEDLLAVFFPLIDPTKAKTVKFVLGYDEDEEDDEEVVTLPPTNEWDN